MVFERLAHATRNVAKDAKRKRYIIIFAYDFPAIAPTEADLRIDWNVPAVMAHMTDQPIVNRPRLMCRASRNVRAAKVAIRFAGGSLRLQQKTAVVAKKLSDELCFTFKT